MNQRIQELAEQAFAPINDMASEGIADRSTFNMHWFRLYNQKFAELIVRECIAICQDTDGEDNIDAKSGRQDCAVEIKEHFGVEE